MSKAPSIQRALVMANLTATIAGPLLAVEYHMACMKAKDDVDSYQAQPDEEGGVEIRINVGQACRIAHMAADGILKENGL